MSELSDLQRSKKRAFLAAFAEVGTLTRAAEIVGMDRNTHYYWLADEKEGELYRELFEDAKKQAADRLEQEARRRAVEGTQKPVFQGGKQVGVVQEYSDTLLIFLMKGAMPEKYRDNYHLSADFNVNHQHHHRHTLDLGQLSETELLQFGELVSKAKREEEGTTLTLPRGNP